MRVEKWGNQEPKRPLIPLLFRNQLSRVRGNKRESEKIRGNLHFACVYFSHKDAGIYHTVAPRWTVCPGSPVTKTVGMRKGWGTAKASSECSQGGKRIW